MQKSIFTEEHKKIQKKMKLARIEAEMTQKDVADKLNIQQSLISRIESGQRRVDIVELKRFAKLYGKSIDFFTKIK